MIETEPRARPLTVILAYTNLVLAIILTVIFWTGGDLRPWTIPYVGICAWSIDRWVTDVRYGLR